METTPRQSSPLWRKARQEIISALRMRDLKIDPLAVLDELYQGMVDLMRNGLREKYPTASEKEIVAMMLEQTRIYTRWRCPKSSRIRKR